MAVAGARRSSIPRSPAARSSRARYRASTKTSASSTRSPVPRSTTSPPRYWRRPPFPKSRRPAPICRPAVSITPAICARSRRSDWLPHDPLAIGRVAGIAERSRSREGSGGRRYVGSPGAGGDFILRLVVPHFRLGKQSPALKRPKHRILTAEGFHGAVANEVGAVANEVLHLAPPVPAQKILKTEIQAPSLRSCKEFVGDAEERLWTGSAIPGKPFDGTSASREGY